MAAEGFHRALYLCLLTSLALPSDGSASSCISNKIAAILDSREPKRIGTEALPRYISDLDFQGTTEVIKNSADRLRFSAYDGYVEIKHFLISGNSEAAVQMAQARFDIKAKIRGAIRDGQGREVEAIWKRATGKRMKVSRFPAKSALRDYSGIRRLSFPDPKLAKKTEELLTGVLPPGAVTRDGKQITVDFSQIPKGEVQGDYRVLVHDFLHQIKSGNSLRAENIFFGLRNHPDSYFTATRVRDQFKLQNLLELYNHPDTTFKLVPNSTVLKGLDDKRVYIVSNETLAVSLSYHPGKSTVDVSIETPEGFVYTAFNKDGKPVAGDPRLAPFCMNCHDPRTGRFIANGTTMTHPHADLGMYRTLPQEGQQEIQDLRRIIIEETAALNDSIQKGGRKYVTEMDLSGISEVVPPTLGARQRAFDAYVEVKTAFIRRRGEGYNTQQAVRFDPKQVKESDADKIWGKRIGTRITKRRLASVKRALTNFEGTRRIVVPEPDTARRVQRMLLEALPLDAVTRVGGEVAVDFSKISNGDIVGDYRAIVHDFLYQIKSGDNEAAERILLDGLLNHKDAPFLKEKVRPQLRGEALEELFRDPDLDIEVVGKSTLLSKKLPDRRAVIVRSPKNNMSIVYHPGKGSVDIGYETEFGVTYSGYDETGRAAMGERKVVPVCANCHGPRGEFLLDPLEHPHGGSMFIGNPENKRPDPENFAEIIEEMKGALRQVGESPI